MLVRGGVIRFVGVLVALLLVTPAAIVAGAGTAPGHAAGLDRVASRSFAPPAAALQTGWYEFSQGAPGCNRVALIFNIGAGWEPATSILDTLAGAGVPATMFVMGWWAEHRPDLVQWMVAAGFPIGSHGYQPPELTLRSDDDIASDLSAATAAIAAASGVAPGPWFTPFAGAVDDRVRAIAANQGYTTVGWGVDSADWRADATAGSVYERVVGGVYDGAIVELHLDAPASAVSTAVALPWIIDELRARGYRLVTVPQMAEPCS